MSDAREALEVAVGGRNAVAMLDPQGGQMRVGREITAVLERARRPHVATPASTHHRGGIDAPAEKSGQLPP
jgi:hypothetical protein